MRGERLLDQALSGRAAAPDAPMVKKLNLFRARRVKRLAESEHVNECE
jgi:hypothetical protein